MIDFYDGNNVLREAFRKVKQAHPFHLDAVVVLPEHLHCVLALPDSDDIVQCAGDK